MKEHRVYETDDGRRFDTESEALQHEHMIEIREKIRDFLKDQEVNERRAAEYERIILAWEGHKISEAQTQELAVVA